MHRLMHLFFVLFTFASLHANDASNETTKETVKKENDPEDLVLTPNANWKDQEPSYYRAPKGATKGIKGLGYPYTLWYDHYAWHESEPLNEHAERSFRLGDEDSAFAIIVTDKHQVAWDDLDDIVIKNAKESGFEHARIASIEKRKVNGNDVIFVHWKALLQGIHVDFLSYLYSGPKGSVFIHTYTPSNIFKDNKKAMELFLNGFTIEPAKTDADTGKDKTKS